MGGKKIARIDGIDIRINWTTLFLVALLMVTLATTAYPALAANQNPIQYWIAAAITSLLFLLSLLAHEMAHSLVARHQGARVTSITLWLLGGVSSIPDDPAGPGQELRRALVGPLTSVVLGVGFLTAAFALGYAGVRDLALDVPVWLAYINIVLGLFNLVPAFPLDGGRVLRAWLWRRRNDELSATATAGRVGNIFGYFLIWSGLLEFLLSNQAGGIWLALVGGFLVMASRAEVAAIVGKSTLGSLMALDVMNKEISVVPNWITLTSLVTEYMIPQHRFIYPVRDMSGAITGIIDLAAVGRTSPNLRVSTAVRSISTPLTDILCVAPSDPAAEVEAKLLADARHFALVMEGGRPVGIITQPDMEATEAAVALIASSQRNKVVSSPTNA